LPTFTDLDVEKLPNCDDLEVDAAFADLEESDQEQDDESAE
jgi:hypothetical protein